MIRRGLTSETFASETIRQVLHAHVVTDRGRASIKFRKLVPLSWLQVLTGASSSPFLPFPLFSSFNFFFFPPVRAIAAFL